MGSHEIEDDEQKFARERGVFAGDRHVEPELNKTNEAGRHDDQRKEAAQMPSQMGFSNVAGLADVQV